MKTNEYPITPPKGILHFPQGVMCLIKQEDTGKEEVKIRRISGDEFEFEIIPKDLTETEQRNFPIRICEKEELSEDDINKLSKEEFEKQAESVIVKSEKKVDITVSPKQIVKITDSEVLKLGNTVTYAAGTDLITVTTDTYTLDQINTAIADNAQWQKEGESHHCKANLYIASNGKIIDENSSFQLGSTATRQTFQTAANCEFTLERCSIRFYTGARKTSYGLWQFKKSTLIHDDTAAISLYMRGDQNHSDSVMKVAAWYNRDGICSYDNVKVYNSSAFYYYTSGTLNLLYVSGNTMCYFNSPTFKNTTIVGNLAIISSGIYITAINTTWGSLAFSNANNYLLEKWEVDWLVTNPNAVAQISANYELKDNTDVVKASGITDGSGRTTLFEAIVARYDGTSEIKTDYNNFNLKVVKDDDKTEYKIIIDRKIEKDIVLLPQSIASYDNIIAGINDIKGTSFIKDVDSLINIRPKVDFIKNINEGKWELIGDQMIFFESDNVTEIARFNLFDRSGNPTMTNVFKREFV